MKHRLLALFIVSLFSSIGTLMAQDAVASEKKDSTTVYKIEIVDGTSFIGNILFEGPDKIEIKTSVLPKVEIPRTKIRSIEIVDKSSVIGGIYWFPNPNATRYFFSPSAFNLKAGEGYYQNTYLLINSFNIGVTDNFSIGGGFELLSTFGGLGSNDYQPIFFVTPKLGFKVSENFHAGAGVIYARGPFLDGDQTGVGVTYGLGTYGSIEHNITGGLGWGFVDGDFESDPFITISGMTRISKKMALVSENWIVPDNGSYYSVFSYGLRFLGESVSVDLAFINNGDIAEEIFIGIPYVDFVVKF